MEMSIEDLMSVKITSVAKKTQALSEAAAAIFVITQEDIRRSGVTSIAEALRMVPGLQVARIDANKWAITARGFSGRFSNKLLVLIDGRSVYTPIFSGVFWDAQDTLLEDIERIEVIRGPGATLWGANAVNGVINIITKTAKDTQGGLIYGGAGTEEQGFGGFRYGTKSGDHTYWRIYTKYFNRDDAVYASGDDAADGWDVLRGGFRMDWQGSSGDSLTLSGDIYDGELGETITTPSLAFPYSSTTDEEYDESGGNLLGRWERKISETSDMGLQLYYDRFDIDPSIIGVSVDTVDIDFQHRFSLGDQQEIIWGLGYRYISDEIDNSSTVSFIPDSRHYDILSAFVQDDIIVVEDLLHLILGSKFEDNDYTGFEVQPNARLTWMPHEQHSVWAAVSRAVRTPSRAEDDVRIGLAVIPPGIPQNPAPLPLVLTAVGNRDFDSEELLAYEIGYRVRPMDELSLDVTAFFNDYDSLRSSWLATPFPEPPLSPTHMVLPLAEDNEDKAETYGVELAADWRPSDWWHFQAAYTYLNIVLEADEESSMVSGGEAASPHHQVSLRSAMDLPGALEFHLWFRYVDELPSLDVDDYITLDTRLGWHPRQNLEISVVGQNLLDNQHLEYKPEFLDTAPTEVEHSIYAKITWHF
jgi:iron complex outermembrane receptor protein